MSEARDIERAGLVVMESAREARGAATEVKEASSSLDFAVARLREERQEMERVLAEGAQASLTAERIAQAMIAFDGHAGRYLRGAHIQNRSDNARAFAAGIVERLV